MRIPWPRTLHREEREAPSTADLVGVLVSLLLATWAAVPIAQSDGDLLAHVALGRELLMRTPSQLASLMAEPADVVPAWGSAVMFAALHAVGGLAAIVGVVAVMAGVTHALSTAWLARWRPAGIPTLLAGLIGVTLASSHWLARPHAMSLLASAVLMALLSSNVRVMPIAVGTLFLCWTNLHGGWSFGLSVVIAWTLGAIVVAWRAALPHDEAVVRARARQSLGALAAATAATFINPFGWRLHAAVWCALGDRRMQDVIVEYARPSWRVPGDVFFLVLLLMSTAWLLWRWRQRASPLPLPELLVVLITAAFALTASRNIALFGVTGWPLLARHALRRDDATVESPVATPRVRTVTAWSIIPFGALLAIGLAGGRIGRTTIINGAIDTARFPVASGAWLRTQSFAAGQGATLLTTWPWSGYIPFVWPGRRAVFNPLAFGDRDLVSLGAMLLAQPGWRAELDARDIDVVLLPVRSPASVPLADSLLVPDPRYDEWRRVHVDATAIVYVRHRR